MSPTGDINYSGVLLERSLKLLTITINKTNGTDFAFDFYETVFLMVFSKICLIFIKSDG
jgi:hypothetical protein